MNEDLKAFGECCRKELTDNILPFWMEHGFDREHGGVYTCLDRDGSLMDPTKSVWFQGRFAYALSYAYNQVEKNEEWLQAAKATIDFSEAHCFDKRGRMYFEVKADGTPLRMRRYLFSEAFAAIAHAEYAKALGANPARSAIAPYQADSVADGRAACPHAAAIRHHIGRAMELFRFIREAQNDPELCPAKYEPAMATQGHSLTMILINVANVLKQVSDDPSLDEQIDESVDKLFRYFVKPEFKCILETVGPNGEFIDTGAGRTINPGHGIETSWFLMDVAKARGDKALLEKALQILDWQWNWGWDGENGKWKMENGEWGDGGIISFRDCKGYPPQCYEQDMKFWWPQCEAIIANLEAYELTGGKKWLERFELVRDWAWKHLKDPDYPEWFGYLHRDGTVAQPAKGNIFKGPFHIPRMLVKCMQLCQEEPAK